MIRYQQIKVLPDVIKQLLDQKLIMRLKMILPYVNLRQLEGKPEVWVKAFETEPVIMPLSTLSATTAIAFSFALEKADLSFADNVAIGDFVMVGGRLVLDNLEMIMLGKVGSMLYISACGHLSPVKVCISEFDYLTLLPKIFAFHHDDALVIAPKEEIVKQRATKLIKFDASVYDPISDVPQPQPYLIKADAVGQPAQIPVQFQPKPVQPVVLSPIYVEHEDVAPDLKSPSSLRVIEENEPHTALSETYQVETEPNPGNKPIQPLVQPIEQNPPLQQPKIYQDISDKKTLPPMTVKSEPRQPHADFSSILKRSDDLENSFMDLVGCYTPVNDVTQPIVSACQKLSRTEIAFKTPINRKVHSQQVLAYAVLMKRIQATRLHAVAMVESKLNSILTGQQIITQKEITRLQLISKDGLLKIKLLLFKQLNGAKVDIMKRHHVMLTTRAAEIETQHCVIGDKVHCIVPEEVRDAKAAASSENHTTQLRQQKMDKARSLVDKRKKELAQFTRDRVQILEQMRQLNVVAEIRAQIAAPLFVGMQFDAGTEAVVKLVATQILTGAQNPAVANNLQLQFSANPYTVLHSAAAKFTPIVFSNQVGEVWDVDQLIQQPMNGAHRYVMSMQELMYVVARRAGVPEVRLLQAGMFFARPDRMQQE